MIAGIVLAAGPSTRMGRPKMLLPLGGGTVLSAAVAPLLEAGLPLVVVVLGCAAEQVRRRAGLPRHPALRVAVNARWRDGMASSLRCGLEACAGADAVLVALGDQPGVSATLVARIVEAWRPGVGLVLPVRGGRAGHPVLFGGDLFGELRALEGDVGGRGVVRRHWAGAIRIDGEPLRDLDTPEDYEALLEGRPGRGDEGLEVG